MSESLSKDSSSKLDSFTLSFTGIFCKGSLDLSADKA